MPLHKGKRLSHLPHALCHCQGSSTGLCWQNEGDGSLVKEGIASNYWDLPMAWPSKPHPTVSFLSGEPLNQVIPRRTAPQGDTSTTFSGIRKMWLLLILSHPHSSKQSSVWGLPPVRCLLEGGKPILPHSHEILSWSAGCKQMSFPYDSNDIWGPCLHIHPRPFPSINIVSRSASLTTSLVQVVGFPQNLAWP